MCKEQIRGIIHQYAPQAPIGGMPGQDNLEMLQNMAVETVDMLIPQNKVGLVIGRGGETIKDLAVQSGCKMNMVQDGIYATAPEKPLRMHGLPHQIEKARQLVSGIIQQQEFQNQQRGGGGGGFNSYNSYNSQGNQPPPEASTELPVPKEYVGVVIGRSGDTIKRLQSETGATVKFNTVDPNIQGERYLTISGSKEAVAEAEARVKELLAKVALKDSKGGPNQQSEVYHVPANKCGLVIGKKGETINRMKEHTGAHVEMDKNSPHDAPTKQFFIKGTPEQIKAAKEEISKIIGDGQFSSGGGYGGGYGGGGGGYGGSGYGGYGGNQGGGGGGYGGQQQMMSHQDPAAMAYQQQMAAYYAQYYPQQMGGGMPGQQPGAGQQQSAPPSSQPAAAPATSQTSGNNSSQSVQQQWAAYYQQLVQMYGEQQAQVYWTQLSQQQGAASKPQ